MEQITMAHGSGGESTSELIGAIFAKYFENPYLDQMEDSTVVPGNALADGKAGKLAMTTDSFVVTPVIYPGGDIGRLCVCGTVNDVLMSGAVPKYLTCGFILEEGLAVDTLEQCVKSMAETAKEAGVYIVAGDTKVVERRSDGAAAGLMINTAGVGFLREDAPSLSPKSLEDGDVIIVSGNLGDHHAAILGQRMGIENDIESDNAPLNEMVNALMDPANGIHVHELRDVTRGGLATVLNEFADASNKAITLKDEQLPVSMSVKSFAGILGLDPLYMGNEGKMIAIVAGEDADRALELIRGSRYGEKAAIVGTVRACAEGEDPVLLVETGIGGTRVVGPLYGEGLPRIC